ncbi:MAG: hypothetical protein AAGA44_17180 [Pseudomonadota bacterium]
MSAVERKSILEVDTNALTTETQRVMADGDSLDLIWWILPEFWEATLRQDPGVPEAQADQTLDVLRGYSVVAVVQADISPFGAFRFFEKDTIMDGLTIESIDADGVASTISHREPVDPDLMLILSQMQPILAQALGNMGENMFFFPIPASDAEGNRRPSPYESAELRVTLTRGDADVVMSLDAPLDSLFVPRICPNGKPAHVSWVYCPWSGAKLPK